MKRRTFIKHTTTAALCTGLLPTFSFTGLKPKFTRNQLMGKGNPDIVGKTYTGKMHKAAATAFATLKEAAKEDGITIEVVSAYRSFQRQKEIYESKYRRFTSQGLPPEKAIKKIITYSTIPGTSRHHWGTDIDIIDGGVAPRPENVLRPGLFHGEGPFCKLKTWLDKNAETFGFFEVYTNNANRKGFKYEPWHYSYAPVSKPMLKAYKKLDIKEILTGEKIKGAAHFTEEFIEMYRTEHILGINPNLLS